MVNIMVFVIPVFHPSDELLKHNWQHCKTMTQNVKLLLIPVTRTECDEFLYSSSDNRLTDHTVFVDFCGLIGPASASSVKVLISITWGMLSLLFCELNT